MNLEFGILWIEDNFFRGEKEKIRDAAATAGFEVQIVNSRDGSDLSSFAEHQRRYHCFDLILLDLNLANNVRGDELAEEVRRYFRSTPMLFYSSQESEAALRSRMAERKIEGVFSAHRDTFITRASELISELSESVNRLSGMRGLAARVVAECDDILRAIILKTCCDDKRDDFAKTLDKNILSSMKSAENKYVGLGSLEERLTHPAVGSYQMFKHARICTTGDYVAHLDGETGDRLRQLRTETRGYKNRVLDKRNILSHVKEQDAENGWVLTDQNGGAAISASDFPELRRVLLRHLTSFREMYNLIIEHRVE